MHIHDLAKAYATKTNDELQQLATDSEQLTPEARAVLKGELAKRRIDGVENLNAPRQRKQTTIETPGNPEVPFVEDSHSIATFVAEVLRVYH